MEKEYDLRGKKYIQRPLVLGQIQELLPLIEKVKFPKDADALTIAQSLGESINRALAIILLEKDKDEPEPEKIKIAMESLGERSAKISYSIEAEQVLGVIEDFFDCNRASSIIERIGEMMRNMRARISEVDSTLKKSSGDLLAGISQKGKGSSGE